MITIMAFVLLRFRWSKSYETTAEMKNRRRKDTIVPVLATVIRTCDASMAVKCEGTVR